MVPTKVPAPLQRILDRQLGKVLPTEGNDLALSYETGQLVFARARELRELDTADLAPDGWREVDDLGVRWEEVLEGGIGILAVFVVLEGRQGRISLARVPRGKVVGILLRLEEHSHLSQLNDAGHHPSPTSGMAQSMHDEQEKPANARKVGRTWWVLSPLRP